MLEIKVNGSAAYKVAQKEEQLLLDDKPVDWSCEPLGDGSFSIILDHRSYRAELLALDAEQKTVRIQVNGRVYDLEISEPIDRLLKKMGLNERVVARTNEIKAPMPGMILNIMVSVGQQLQKGDPVLILEAMKMENIFKAPETAVVKEIKVKEHTAVEKGQVLVVME